MRCASLEPFADQVAPCCASFRPRRPSGLHRSAYEPLRSVLPTRQRGLVPRSRVSYASSVHSLWSLGRCLGTWSVEQRSEAWTCLSDCRSYGSCSGATVVLGTAALPVGGEQSVLVTCSP